MALIALENMTHVYGAHVALRDVSLQVQPGRIGLLGPNGAGKSTLLKIILGLLVPKEGHGTVLGMDIRRGSLELRRRIGYMSEADALIPGLRGAEYVTLAGELCGMPARHAARRAHELLNYLGLEEARYRKLEEYSTGMKQRLKLAQALVHDPPLLLLDEPTSGLDAAGRDDMLNLLLTLGRDHGKSLIISTHHLSDVERICDQVVIVFAGQVRRSGLFQELRTRRQDRFCLQVQARAGGLAHFIEDLKAEGVRILEYDGREELRVAVPEGWVTRMFFTLADNGGVILRGLQRDDEDLEQLFLRVMTENQANGA
jgi:ABC-2 type transport system ATP-binding protein